MKISAEDKLRQVMECPKKVASLKRRLNKKVSIADNDNDCWEWMAKARHSFGYGSIVSGRGFPLKAHRVTWWLVNGEIPNGMVVCHKCDNPACCNPYHLFLGTKKDNTQDMIKKKRNSNPPTHWGENHPNAKLDFETVCSIRNDNRTIKQLAVIYNTSEQTIWRMKNYKTRIAG